MGHKKEIDLCNAVFCLFIVLIHLTPGELLQRQGIFFLHRTMNFATFGFVFLSGLKNAMGRRESYRGYYLGRWKKIVLPYLLACVIYWLVYGLEKGLGLALSRLVQGVFSGELDAHFYFVIVIVQFYLLTPVVDWLSRRYSATAIMAVSWCVNLAYVLGMYGASWYSRLFPRYLVCYMLGICAGTQYDRFTGWLKEKRTMILCGYALLLAGELYAAWAIRVDGISGVVQQLINLVYNPVAVCGFYSICLLGKSWHMVSESKVLSAINRHSYPIYLYHILVNFLGDQWAKQLGISSLPNRLAMRVAWCVFWLSALVLVRQSLGAKRSASWNN